MTLNEIIEKRKILNTDSDEIIERELKPILEDGKSIIHDFVNNEDLGYHYRVEPEIFKSLLEDYKAGKIPIDLVWDYIKDSLIEVC